MNKIEEMIKELCPEGVKKVKLGEVCENIKTGRLNANAMVKDGLYPFFTCDSIPYRIDTYAFDEEAIIISGNGSQVGHINYYSGKFNAYQRTYVLYGFDGNSISFVLYYLKSYLKDYIFRMSKKGSIPYITMPMLQEFEIPLPPLSVQQEIVRVLDSFSSLQSKLEEELEARQKQMEYYREKLLTFEKDDKSVKWMKLGEVGTLIRGNGLQKKDFKDEGVGCIHYGQIYTRLGLFVYETLSFVEEELADRLTQVYYGDIVMACTSENVEDVCKSVVWLGQDRIVTGGHSVVFRHKENPKYIAYCFTTNSFFEQKRKYAYGAKVVDIKTDKLAQIVVPVPPLSRQQEIVSTLDTISSLIDNLKAEIELRKSQYEYYREKLLTFE